MAKMFSYSKAEKLKSRKLMDQLFREGKTFSIFPLKVFYMQPTAILDFPVKAGVGVSSRNFKKAIHRNRVKRIMREAYRTEKNVLHDYLNLHQKQVVVFMLYIDKILPEYETIKTVMPVVLQRLVKKLNETAAANT
ncbi:MAG TPA: ribonuclease P protein component [Panacibacter sp.]|nr:ribonuclease P protein component [Panacibacter sp.]